MRAHPRALASRVVRLDDDVAQAAAAKLALNFLMFANVGVFAEAMSYVARTVSIRRRSARR